MVGIGIILKQKLTEQGVVLRRSCGTEDIFSYLNRLSVNQAKSEIPRLAPMLLQASVKWTKAGKPIPIPTEEVSKDLLIWGIEQKEKLDLEHS